MSLEEFENTPDTKTKAIYFDEKYHGFWNGIFIYRSWNDNLFSQTIAF